ncbi:hypothetical protein X971_2589 [Agrobacterium tumefaciens LBA4213 (Ach5)]|jgi:hypothetical protein|nr:hypothetical protein X971_2589 [Agrobacterium tumefaciens LBA4213 (Ach5)]
MSIVLADVVEIKLTQNLPLPSPADIRLRSETFRDTEKSRLIGTVKTHEKLLPS